MANDAMPPAGERRRPVEPLPASEAPFDAIGLARHLLRSVRSGALATIDAADGTPFASLVTIATDADGTPLMLLSRLSAHTRNLLTNPRCSLLFAQTGKGDPLAHPRLTVTGRVTQTQDPRARARFVARHPKSKLYADFPDFGFFALEPTAGHLNGGFAKAAVLTADELRLDLTGDRTARVLYPEPVREMGALRKVLVTMAAQARKGDADKDAAKAD